MAGHSKWANIKHRKARQDQKRGKMWSKCSKAIMAAAKTGGGDPDANLALRYAIDEAKAVNMPKDTIQNAIDKATGAAGGADFESIVYEGYGPAGVAIMLDILTDNRNRTAPEIRKIFEKGGGNLGASGCVAYNFQQRGQVFVGKAATEEQVMEAALDAGAEDIEEGGESWEVLCEPSAMIAVREAITAAGMTVESASIAMIPQTWVELRGDEAAKAMRLIDNLEDHDDVQKVYANVDIPEDELAALQQ
jgi:YebC/PmpR family DNA-binding regulatory protein